MVLTHSEIALAYRHLYKNLLRAVQYSKPARFTARDCLRVAFQVGDVEEYDRTRIARTLSFLDTAAKTKGLEHKIVKNLMHVWWEQQHQKGAKLQILEARKDAYRDFNHTIKMLDESMGLCVSTFIT